MRQSRRRTSRVSPHNIDRSPHAALLAFLEFWHTFVRISVVMEWIEHGYAVLWTTVNPAARESRNA